MARPFNPSPDWLPDAIDLIVRTDVSLREAVGELNIGITSVECENLARRKSFQKALATARNKYQQEIGSDPLRTKQAAIGKLYILAEKLERAGDFDKAAEVLFKAAKLDGWIGSESNVNVFGSLSGKEFEDVRKELLDQQRKQLGEDKPSSKPAQPLVN